jgi:hypothetical protein
MEVREGCRISLALLRGRWARNFTKTDSDAHAQREYQRTDNGVIIKVYPTLNHTSSPQPHQNRYSSKYHENHADDPVCFAPPYWII